jgi:MFS family permease
MLSGIDYIKSNLKTLLRKDIEEELSYLSNLLKSLLDRIGSIERINGNTIKKGIKDLCKTLEEDKDNQSGSSALTNFKESQNLLNKNFAPLLMSIFLSVSGVTMILPIISVYLDSLGNRGMILGTILATYYLTQMIFNFIVGKISDHYGKKMIISLGFFIYILVGLGFVISPSPSFFIFVRLFQGIASCMVLPVASAYIGLISPYKREGKYLGYFNTSHLFADSIGPLLGGILADFFNNHTVFLAMSLFNLLALMIIIRWASEINPSNYSLRRNNFSLSFKNGKLIPVLIIAFFLSLSDVVYTYFLPLLLKKINISLSQIGLLLGIECFVAALLSSFAGRLIDKYSKKKIFASIITLDALFLLAVPLAGEIFYLLLLSIGFGITGSFLYSAPRIYVAKISNKYNHGEDMGASQGILAGVMSMGKVFGLLYAGLVAFFKVSFVFYLAGFLEILGLGLFIYFQKGKSAVSKDNFKNNKDNQGSFPLEEKVKIEEIKEIFKKDIRVEELPQCLRELLLSLENVPGYELMGQ